MIRQTAIVGVVSFIFAIGTLSMAAKPSVVAPIIEQLPSVIIGDEGDASGSGETARHLFRYTNILNIATSHRIQWKNKDLGFGDNQKHAYYISTPTGAIQASTDQRLVSELTYNDTAAMQMMGTRPAAEKEITDRAGDGGWTDFFWLSLSNNISGAANAYTATIAADGQPLFAFEGKLNPAVVTLVLADGDFPNTAVAQADFTVYTIPGAEDGFSGASARIYATDFDSGSEGWVYKGYGYFSSIVDAIPGVSDGAVTLRIGTDSSKYYFGSWASGQPGGTAPQTVVPVNQAAMQGNIFRAKFTLTSTADNALNTPGYRLFYESEAFTHLGGVSHDSTDSTIGSSVGNTPSKDSPKDITVYWALPFALTGYGDTGALATIQAGKDFRAYFLSFEMLGYEHSDTGILGLTNVVVDIIPRPDSSVNLVNWGAGGNAFNSSLNTSGWVAGRYDEVGIGNGTCNVNATNISICAIRNSATSGYQKTGLFANATVLPAWQSNKLIRTNVQVGSSAVNFSPEFRVLTLSSRTSGMLLPLIWVDCFSGNTAKQLWGPAKAGAAASPATGAGSLLETYLWTHTAGSGQAAGVLVPQFDCYTTGSGIMGGNAQGSWEWPVQNATLTITKYQYEECVVE